MNKTQIQIPTKKHPGGRPRNTLAKLIAENKLPEDWEAKILFYSAQGMSAEQIRTRLCTSGKPGTKKWKFNHVAWGLLQENESEFLSAVKIGEMLCKSWWLDAGQKGLHKKVFNTGCWYANMKNRFGWHDKTEIEIEAGVGLFEKYREMTVEQLNKRYQELNSGSHQN